MPSQRAPTIERVVAAYNARDVDEFIMLVTADFEMVSRFSSVAGTVFRGHDGVIAWWQDLADAWETLDLHYEGSTDIGTDRTVLLFNLRGKGQGSGMHIDEPVAQRWHWRGGRIARIEYLDRLEGEAIVKGEQ